MIDSKGSPARIGGGSPTSVCEDRAGLPRDRTVRQDRRSAEGFTAVRALAAGRGHRAEVVRRGDGGLGGDAGDSRLHLRGPLVAARQSAPAASVPVPAQAFGFFLVVAFVCRPHPAL